MENKQMIYTRQFVWLLFILFTSFAVLKLPSYLIYIAKRDCWLCIIFAWVADVLFGTIYAYMNLRFRGQSYIQHSITIWGNYLGRIPGIILLLFFMLFCASSLNTLSLIVTKMMLPKTPIMLIRALNVFVAAYCAKKGLKVLGRVCELMGPIFFASLVILILLIVPFVKIENLQPQLTVGLPQMFVGSYFVLSYLGICIIMTMYIPYNDIQENGFLGKFLASSLGSIIVLIFSVCSIGVFGVNQAKQMIYSSFELAKIIHFDYYIERLESLWLLIAITACIVTASTLFWVCSLGLAQLTKIKDHNSLINSMALLIFILSATSFGNDAYATNFSLFVYPIFAFVITLFEFLLFFTAVITKKKSL